MYVRNTGGVPAVDVLVDSTGPRKHPSSFQNLRCVPIVQRLVELSRIVGHASKVNYAGRIPRV